MICSGNTSNFVLTPARSSTRAAHGVDQRDLRRHELRHVLVAGGDQHAEVLPSRRAQASVPITSSASTPVSRRMRQAHAAHRFEQRLDLRAQVVGHRRAMRLVLGEQLVAEGLAGRVEHHRDALAGRSP